MVYVANDAVWPLAAHLSIPAMRARPDSGYPIGAPGEATEVTNPAFRMLITIVDRRYMPRPPIRRCVDGCRRHR
jgi:hypothetical protein